MFSILEEHGRNSVESRGQAGGLEELVIIDMGKDTRCTEKKLVRSFLGGQEAGRGKALFCSVDQASHQHFRLKNRYRIIGFQGSFGISGFRASACRTFLFLPAPSLRSFGAEVKELGAGSTRMSSKL